MDKHEAFGADVIREFKFLEDEYALRREPHHITGEGSWITYGGLNVAVIIELEQGNSVGVTVRNLRYVKRDPLERGEFDLEEVAALAGGQRQQGRGREPRNVTEAVARAAQTLRATGPSVLGGDFEALHARQRKAVEGLRRHTPLGPEKEPPQ